MVVHHLLEWTGGDARERIVGFEGLAITDLAAPVFAVGLGAAAHLVGRRIVAPGGDRLVIGRRSLERWLRVLLAGLVIDVAVGGGIDGGGVAIGRAHVCTPVTHAQLVCRLLLEKKKQT